MPSLKFKRGERLKSFKVISHLFSGNRPTIKAFPLLAVYDKVTIPNREYPVQIAFSIPKRKFKSAAERNLIKRRIKEGYRINKADFYKKVNLQENEQLVIMLIYIAGEVFEFNKIEPSIKKVIRKLEKELR